MKGVIGRLNGDPAIGMIVALIGGAVVLLARGFPELTGDRPGPSLFPSIVGTLLVIFGLALLVLSLRARQDPATGNDQAIDATSIGARPGGRTAPANASPWLNVVVVVIAPMAFVWLAPMVGSLPTLAIVALLLLLRLGVRPVRAVVTSMIATAAIQVLFVNVMGVFLPG